MYIDMLYFVMYIEILYFVMYIDTLYFVMYIDILYFTVIYLLLLFAVHWYIAHDKINIMQSLDYNSLLKYDKYWIATFVLSEQH